MFHPSIHPSSLDGLSSRFRQILFLMVTDDHWSAIYNGRSGQFESGRLFNILGRSNQQQDAVGHGDAGDA